MKLLKVSAALCLILLMVSEIMVASQAARLKGLALGIRVFGNEFGEFYKA
ncbi:hypothetical protein KC19_3G018600 [Ceratodon purpureus]|uniref:Uncharacterized protein n=1 Tax=Ceratodon purpureus TaxID=3225 RepID=A0A8T0IEV4_CERPU|nr:hypothetical protein KC19_3G018600 [Ceratodon purpureus]